MPENCTVINTLPLKRLDKLTKYITSIVPLKRDTERQWLDQFAIISQDHVTKERVIRVIQHNKQTRNYVQLQAIEFPGLKWAYIHPRSDGQNMIQVIVEHEEQYEMQCYMITAEAEEQKGQDTAPPYSMLPAQFMDKILGTSFIPMRASMTTESDQMYGCFIEKAKN